MKQADDPHATRVATMVRCVDGGCHAHAAHWPISAGLLMSATVACDFQAYLYCQHALRSWQVSVFRVCTLWRSWVVLELRLHSGH